MIEPRQQTMVCAMLAGVDWIEAGFLAKTMGLSEEELRRQTAELVAAQYINVHPYNGRWWFGFTAFGRAALSPSSASPATRVRWAANRSCRRIL